MVNQETGQRGFLLSGKEISLEPYHQGKADFSQNIQRLRNHFRQSGYQSHMSALLDNSENMAQAWAEEAADPEIEARREMNRVNTTMEDLIRFMEKGEGKRHMDAIREEINRFIAEEEVLIELRTDKADNIGAMTISVTVASFFISVVLVIFSSYLLAKKIYRQIGAEPEYMATITRRIADGDLRTPLSSSHQTARTGIYSAMFDMSGRLRSMLSKILETARTQSQSTHNLVTIAEETSNNVRKQQDSTAEIVSALSQLRATASEVATSTMNVAGSANQAREMVDLGNQKADQVSAQIQALSEELRRIATSIQELSNSANGISNILDVIKNIADQTNLLAPNAAIEAARAGEQGRGFAVVADEVRSLAQNTQNSTSEIETMIVQLQQGANASVEAASKGVQQAEDTVTET